MKTKIIALAAVALVAGCTAGAGTQKEPEATTAQALAVMKASFLPKGQAKLDRLDQDEVQKACSDYHPGKPIPKELAERIEKSQLATVKYPADGKLMGDWKSGEKIAQSGVGKQYSDDPKVVAGGNCYACHELTKQELAFGTIGPSLYHFGKLRGFTPEMQKYAYAKVYNPDAFSACSNMPRFGHNGILTEQQVKDVVALLMDPESPVNK
ncbi:MAG: sulfur oxidation c-type cytochrome SoxX [Betaproteobacteria bacterium]